MPNKDRSSLRLLLQRLVIAERKRKVEEMADMAKSIDQSVARRIRQRRIELGITQQRLAELVGVAFQQQHKYEHGVDRITAGRLHLIANALETRVEYFFYNETGGQPSQTRDGEKVEGYHVK